MNRPKEVNRLILNEHIAILLFIRIIKLIYISIEYQIYILYSKFIECRKL